MTGFHGFHTIIKSSTSVRLAVSGFPIMTNPLSGRAGERGVVLIAPDEIVLTWTRAPGSPFELATVWVAGARIGRNGPTANRSEQMIYLSYQAPPSWLLDLAETRRPCDHRKEELT